MGAAAELCCCVEIPKGSLARGAGSPIDCPADYGYFPDTLCADGGPLRALICGAWSSGAGSRVLVNPIALLRTHDDVGHHETLICVRRDDRAWNTIASVDALPASVRGEIERFLAARVAPGGSRVRVVGWLSRDEAHRAIDDAAARWAATVDGHG